MSPPSQPLLRREGGHTRRPPSGRRVALDPRHGGSRTRDPARTVARRRAAAGDRVPWHELGTGIGRYLPLAVLATLSVTVVPAVLANTIVPSSGPAATAGRLLCAVTLSVLIAVGEARIWRRQHGARGVMYGDLMLWGFARRLWAERRLKRVGAAYRAAVGEDATVRVELLEGMSHLLEVRNPYTSGHCRRVARHCERIALEMHLDECEVAEIRTAALVHDVGKVYVPTEILHKEGPLDDEEFEVIKAHAANGADMLAPVRDAQLASIVRHHHERIDGSGYPDGLIGDEIPLGARIIAVADTFDAITSHRPYRRARSERDAMAVLDAEAGRLLDAEAVTAFARSYSPRRSFASISFAGAVSSRLADSLQLIPAGLFGGASLAGLIPAVGAAGLLAVAPDARYAKSPSPATGGAAFQAAFPGGLEEPGTTGAAPGSGAPAFTRGGTGPTAPRRHSPATGRTGPGGPVSGGGFHQGSPSQSPAGASPGPTGSPGSPVSEGAGGENVVEVPTPPGVPPVKVPTVSTPTISTPTVTTPPASAGGVTVPSVTVPSVTVQSVNVPSITTPPGVKLPGARGPGS